MQDPLEIDNDRVGAKRKCQPGTLGLQVKQHAVGILKPELTRALVGDGHSITGLAIGTCELPELGHIEDVAGRLHLGDADTSDAKAADGKSVAFPLELQGPAAQISAADESDLDLLDFDRACFDTILRTSRRRQEQPGTSQYGSSPDGHRRGSLRIWY